MLDPDPNPFRNRIRSGTGSGNVMHSGSAKAKSYGSCASSSGSRYVNVSRSANSSTWWIHKRRVPTVIPRTGPEKIYSFSLKKSVIRHPAFAFATLCKFFGKHSIFTFRKETSSLIFAITIIVILTLWATLRPEQALNDGLPAYDFSCDVPAEKEHETPVRSSVNYWNKHHEVSIAIDCLAALLLITFRRY